MFTGFLISCVLLGSASSAAAKGIVTNEVLKAVQDVASAASEHASAADPAIKPTELEAYYYRMYGDLVNNAMGQAGRAGSVTTNDTCSRVRRVPESLRHPRGMRPNGISHYYQKYSEAYGIPVLGSSEVSDRAVSRACYILRFLLADRSDLRVAYYRSYGRVAVIASGDVLTTLPEYHFLPEVYDQGTSGLGAIAIAPVSSAKEENVMCWRNDSYGREDVMLREIAQGIFHLAARIALPGLEDKLQRLYDRAMASGWWRHTYAALTPDSYFGEAVQSYFDVNGYSRRPNGVHNSINTRTKLRSYDSELFMLVHVLWPCGNSYIKRCSTRGFEYYQRLNTDCPKGHWPVSRG